MPGVDPTTNQGAASPAGLAIMISGTGRTMVNLAQQVSSGALAAEIRLVIASRSCPGADRARSLGLPVLIVPGVIDPAILGRILKDHDAAWVALGGYLKKIRIPPGYEGRIANIHPALLPSFGGAGMYGHRVHQAVIDAGCKVSGCTVHLCDEEFDRGPIMAQAACPVLDEDTSETLAARVFELECDIYPRALNDLITGRAQVRGARVFTRGS